MNIFKYLTVILSVIVIALLFGIQSIRSQFERTNKDISYASKYIPAIWNMRNVALLGNAQDAAKMLFELEDEPFQKYVSHPLTGELKDLVDLARKHATEDIVVYLRTNTGKDLGKKPGPWILEFGDDVYRGLQKELQLHVGR